MDQISGFRYPHRIVRAKRREELSKAIGNDHLSGRLAESIFRSYQRIFSCPQPDLDSSAGALAHFAPLPQKLLAARSGLARYGKNNIAYVPKFGSHHILVSYYSSLPCVEETWTEPLMLDACRRCTARRFSPSG